jgi:hypothetical protein
MGICKDVNKLTLDTQARVRPFLEALVSKGIKFAVIETLRPQEIQDVYFMQGREPLEKVNARREELGLWALTEAEGKRCVTWTHTSKHKDGNAIDVAPLDAKGNIAWNAPFDVWERIGEVGEAHGLDWGGRWAGKNLDCPHFQFDEV